MENYKYIIFRNHKIEKHLFIGTFTYVIPYNMYRVSKKYFVEISPVKSYTCGTLVLRRVHCMWDFSTNIQDSKLN